MSLFESTLILLAVSILLLFVARRVGVPYPSMLALAGGCVAVLPWSSPVAIEPHLALALFVAPAVMEAASDMPPRLLVRHWLPLMSLAVVLVLVTTAVVAWVAWSLEGLPITAAIALGAVVAPPDAAAATAVLERFQLPRRTMAVLQGESLLNDAVVLLIFGAAVGATQQTQAWTAALPVLLVAVPGGLILGTAIGACGVYLMSKMAGTLTSIILQFVMIFGGWVLAEKFGLSSIAAVAALAMVIAHFSPARTSARDRVGSNTVWSAAVFILNVLAFLLVGLQSSVILAELPESEFWHALRFAFLILAVITIVRIGWVMVYGAALRSISARLASPELKAMVPGGKVGILVSWCGMRGLVTLATALALPPHFPSRNLIVLTAFVVVLGTLILQGFTIQPLISLLGIAQDCSLYVEVSKGRMAMIDAAITALKGKSDDVAIALRAEYMADRVIAANPMKPQAQTPYDRLRLDGIARQRVVLARWRRSECLDDDAFHLLEEELDRAELDAQTREGSRLLRG